MRVTGHVLDLAVIVAYLIGITWFGARFRASQRSLKDYFLGGRNAPWWAIGLSIVSAETSTLTVIGTPALAFAGNYGFLQLVLGYLLARVVISVLFLPQYFRGELFTAYELMERRFGPHVRKFTGGTFLLLRTLAEGVRVFAVSIVISVVLGTGEVVSIAVIVCLTLVYTFEGGMTAVIWTDVAQMFLYVVGAIASFFVILRQIPGGWEHVTQVAAPLGKFQIFDFRFEWTAEFFRRPYSFWAGVIGGCFLTTASHGTEQLLVQRLLAAKNERESRRALFGSWVVIAFQFSLFLVIGTLLFVLYRDRGWAAPAVLERIYPAFLWDYLPAGLAGLLTAAILAAAMSNLSAALNALASTTIMDFWRPWRRSAGKAERSDAEGLAMARWVTVAWGAALFGIGLLARQWGRVLEAGLSIASVLYGALLGVFLLGVLTRRPGELAAISGMVAGLVATFAVRGHVAFTWFVLVGSSVTFAVGWLAGFVFPKAEVGSQESGARSQKPAFRGQQNSELRSCLTCGTASPQSASDPRLLTDVKPEGRKKIAHGVSHGELNVRDREPRDGAKGPPQGPVRDFLCTESHPVPSGPPEAALTPDFWLLASEPGASK